MVGRTLLSVYQQQHYMGSFDGSYSPKYTVLFNGSVLILDFLLIPAVSIKTYFFPVFFIDGVHGITGRSRSGTCYESVLSEYPVHQGGFSHVGFADNGDSGFPRLFRFFFWLSESFYAGSNLLHQFVDIFVVKRGKSA